MKQTAFFSQKVNPAAAEMIAELVADGITEIDDVKKALRHRKDSPSDPNDRAYFPMHDDLRNHIYRAKQALQHSKYDQENLRLKVQNWKKIHLESNSFSIHATLTVTATALLLKVTPPTHTHMHTQYVNPPSSILDLPLSPYNELGGAIYTSHNTVLALTDNNNFINNSANSDGGAIWATYNVVLTFNGTNKFFTNSAGSGLHYAHRHIVPFRVLHVCVRTRH